METFRNISIVHLSARLGEHAGIVDAVLLSRGVLRVAGVFRRQVKVDDVLVLRLRGAGVLIP
jgi:hypothetical protein